MVLPRRFWHDSAILITWDDSGGWYVLMAVKKCGNLAVWESRY